MAKKKSKKYWGLEIWKWFLFLGIFGLIMMMPSLFVMKCSSSERSFDGSTGVIGDTIGGITSPFINFFSAILLFLALKEQIKANRIFSKQRKREKADNFEKVIFELINSSLDKHIEKVSNFKFVDFENQQTYYDVKACEIVIKNLFEKNNEEIDRGDELFLLNIIRKVNNGIQLISTDIKRNKQFWKVIYHKHQSLLRAFIFINRENLANYPFEASTESEIEILKMWFQLLLDEEMLYRYINNQNGVELNDFKHNEIIAEKIKDLELKIENNSK